MKSNAQNVSAACLGLHVSAMPYLLCTRTLFFRHECSETLLCMSDNKARPGAGPGALEPCHDGVCGPAAMNHNGPGTDDPFMANQ